MDEYGEKRVKTHVFTKFTC